MIGNSEKILLNIGCGPVGSGSLPSLFDDWRQVRVDVDSSVAPDITADITDLARVGDGVVDAIWTAHCIEHLFVHQIGAALGEIRRVLNDDGFACIVTPDLQRIAAFIAEDRMHEVIYTAPAGPITAHDIVFGFGPAIARGYLSMAHRCGFTPTAMINHLNAAGFGGYALLRRENFELVAVVRKRDWPSETERDALLLNLGL